MAVGAMVSALATATFETPDSTDIAGVAAPTRLAPSRAFTVESAAAITVAGALETSSPVRASSEEMPDLPGASSQEAQQEVSIRGTRIPGTRIESMPAETAPADPVTTDRKSSQEPSKASKQRDKKITQPSQRRRDREFAAPDHNRGKDDGREIRPHSGEWGW